MNKKIEDYLHLYLGCEVICTDETASSDYEYYGRRGKVTGLLLSKYSTCKWSLLLRPLSSMTEEEAIELVKLSESESYGDHPAVRKYETYRNNFGQLVLSWGEGLREKNIPEEKKIFTPEEMRLLLKYNFDLFSLIPAGLALDKTKITV